MAIMKYAKTLHNPAVAVVGRLPVAAWRAFPRPYANLSITCRWPPLCLVCCVRLCRRLVAKITYVTQPWYALRAERLGTQTLPIIFRAGCELKIWRRCRRFLRWGFLLFMNGF